MTVMLPTAAAGADVDPAAPMQAPPPTHDAPPPPRPVHRWALHRRLYDWVLSQAHHKHGTLALFLLAFAESSFFPVPPDVLQIALTLERRNRAFFYAAVSAAGSVIGGVAGYLIGWGLWEAVAPFFLRHVFSESVFHTVETWYRQYDFWVVFVAAFTPIPYKVFTIAAGVFRISLPMFVIASAVGRSGRFLLVAGLLWKFGAPVRRFIDRWFNLICIGVTVVAIGLYVLVEAL